MGDDDLLIALKKRVRSSTHYSINTSYTKIYNHFLSSLSASFIPWNVAKAHADPLIKNGTWKVVDTA